MPANAGRLSPVPRRVARRVLREGGRCKAAPLLDNMGAHATANQPAAHPLGIGRETVAPLSKRDNDVAERARAQPGELNHE